MSYIKQIFLMIGIMLPDIAWADVMWFETIAQAEKYCPAVNALTYYAINRHEGTIKGVNSTGRNFNSFNSRNKNYKVRRPLNISATISVATMANVDFRQSSTGYGHMQDDGAIFCLYHYLDWNSVDYPLLMMAR